MPARRPDLATLQDRRVGEVRRGAGAPPRSPRSPHGRRDRAIRLGLALLLACTTAQGCVTAPSVMTPEVRREAPSRSFRDVLVFGPASMDRVLFRVPWISTIGIATMVIWLPWMIYDASAIGLPDQGNLVTIVRVREGFVRFERDALPRSQEISSVGLAPPPDLDFGRYHALLVGNDDYEHLGKLVTAGNDVEALSALLREEYGFETTVLREATRADLISALYRYRQELGPRDNLLVYYAGHGELDAETEEGYWLPVDARERDPAQWVANSTISTMLKGIDAKHIMVIADSCFAGSLNRSVVSSRRRRDFLARMVPKRARVVLTSGGLEPVADTGGGEHSVFARFLLQALRDNPGVLDGSSLFLSVRKPVVENAYQTPEYGPIRFTGHEGGEFFFVRETEEAEP